MGELFARRSILRFGAGAGAAVALLSSAGVGKAATTSFRADLKGSAEVPPNQSAGTGAVTATFNPDTKQLTWTGTYTGLSGPPTAAHVHGPAGPGKNAGVVFWISDKDVKAHPFTTPFQGSATLTDAQVSDLMAGMYYVNIHTAANPGGELRGQLVKS